MGNLSSQIIQIIADSLGTPKGEMTLESHLVKDLNATPLEIADLITLLEEKFKIKIPQEIYQRFQTVGEIVNFVNEHLDEFTKI